MPKRVLSLQSKFNEFLQTYLTFFIRHLFLISFNEEIFVQQYIEMELKIFFIVLQDFSNNKNKT